ncbi:MAG: flagellar type III secretion system protein FliR [Hyphomicrobiales bacterium]|nr:MAG: flagellar type III secretion system protein FliR [Hyphomicrobiales bacterium]
MTVTFLPQAAILFLLTFSRLGSMVMLLPAFGDVNVPMRIRLVFALALTFVFFPLAEGFYGQVSGALNALLPLIGGEVLVGLLVGGTARLLMSALQVAGTAMSFQMGLSYAQSFDPSQGVQGAILGSFLSVVAATLIMVTDLHHLFLAAIRDSYTMFKPGTLPPLGDFTQLAVDTIASSFRVGVQLTAPFLVFGLVFYLGVGILSRLMPQVQIFFVAMPANILLGLTMLMLLLGAVMMWFLDYFTSSMQIYLL